MANILLIETATDICSIGISKNDQVVALRETTDGYSHASKITILINEVLQEANWRMSDLDAVALSSGPGSYTALRIGTSTAKGICYAMDIPLIVVDTLAALAKASYFKNKNAAAYYIPMIDARRMEVYTAGYNADGTQTIDLHAKIIEPSSFSDFYNKGIPLIFLGNGAPKCQAVLPETGAYFDDTVCSAKALAPLAYQAFQTKSFSDIAYYSPQYLKSPNITKPKKML